MSVSHLISHWLFHFEMEKNIPPSLLCPPSNCFLQWHVKCDPGLIYQPNSEAPTLSPGAPGPGTSASFVFQTGYRQWPASRRSCRAYVCRGMRRYRGPEAFIWSPAGQWSGSLSLPPHTLPTNTDMGVSRDGPLYSHAAWLQALKKWQEGVTVLLAH